ncbi:hypothetical protein FA577_20285 [Salmonella enterica]|nr:hypothetical protein [Salmonella enterica]
MNTQALFCLSLPLVIAGCAQQTSTSTARDSAFAQSLRPPVFSDIYQRSPEVTRSGRYTLVSVKSADAQREPLNQLIDITMPGQLVNSVGDGFRYLLFQSGYSLCGRYGADFAELLKRPLPAVQRKIGPMRLSEALQVVAGPAWRMSVDEVNREVCFVLRDAYLAQAKTPVSTTPIATVSGTPSVYASVETSRNPYTGVLPGKKAAPVMAGQLLASRKDTGQKPVTVTGAVTKPLTGTPVTVAPSGPEWKAVAGSTLKESLTDWAGKADCASGGHWVVIWQTSTDYRIDAPLVFKGNFETALVQVFDLYKKADKPLFAEASRLQCLVSVTDKPVDRS